ncbi:glycosyl hydrolase family 71-domain-containing protein [Mycena metata]|uniref:Glycosyl hydrolase family 71-domain-containing protein n=1 Tax=Mycena metata TaxID=1033252 RepID=A0AAD7HDL1_9AGAR|nr:glycosyl hydrolase family 71-domain-containing protein [Mycena metata]
MSNYEQDSSNNYGSGDNSSSNNSDSYGSGNNGDNDFNAGSGGGTGNTDSYGGSGQSGNNNSNNDSYGSSNNDSYGGAQQSSNNSSSDSYGGSNDSSNNNNSSSGNTQSQNNDSYGSGQSQNNNDSYGSSNQGNMGQSNQTSTGQSNTSGGASGGGMNSYVEKGVEYGAKEAGYNMNESTANKVSSGISGELNKFCEWIVQLASSFKPTPLSTMRAFSLLLHSFAFFFYLSSVASSPVGLGQLFGSDQPDQQTTPAQNPSPAHAESNAQNPSPAKAQSPAQNPPTAEVPAGASLASSSAGSSSKPVVAHFIVGNAERYTKDDWKTDIDRAGSAGFDGFALNVGETDWQVDQFHTALDAAAGTDFKLFVSLDMTAISCSNTALLRRYFTEFQESPQYLRMGGKPVISTFAGEQCTFGTANSNDGWRSFIDSTGAEPCFFIPAFFFNNPSTLEDYSVMDGGFNWNAAWPAGDFDINFDPDESWIRPLGGRAYMAGVSPWFFTHYSPDSYNKNFIYLCDNWMFAQRWELLVANRDRIAMVQGMTWNDWGESHYLGPLIKDEKEPESQAWVDRFDHTGWLDLFAYYAQAFKTGDYPVIGRDRIFLWSRLYPSNANANDSLGRPANWQWTRDFLWAVVLLTDPATVMLRCGPNQGSWDVPSGLSKLKLSLTVDCSVTASVQRADGSGMDFSPAGFTFSTTPASYNFNAFVAASP